MLAWTCLRSHIASLALIQGEGIKLHMLKGGVSKDLPTCFATIVVYR